MISSREIINIIDNELVFERNPSSKKALQRLKNKIEAMEDKAIEECYQEHVIEEEKKKKEIFKKASRALEEAFRHA